MQTSAFFMVHLPGQVTQPSRTYFFISKMRLKQALPPETVSNIRGGNPRKTGICSAREPFPVTCAGDGCSLTGVKCVPHLTTQPRDFSEREHVRVDGSEIKKADVIACSFGSPRLPPSGVICPDVCRRRQVSCLRSSSVHSIRFHPGALTLPEHKPHPLTSLPAAGHPAACQPGLVAVPRLRPNIVTNHLHCVLK